MFVRVKDELSEMLVAICAPLVEGINNLGVLLHFDNGVFRLHNKYYFPFLLLVCIKSVRQMTGS